jgi:hypothetical protein
VLKFNSPIILLKLNDMLLRLTVRQLSLSNAPVLGTCTLLKESIPQDPRLIGNFPPNSTYYHARQFHVPCDHTLCLHQRRPRSSLCARCWSKHLCGSSLRQFDPCCLFTLAGHLGLQGILRCLLQHQPDRFRMRSGSDYMHHPMQ